MKEIIDEIIALKKSRNAVILAHNYQLPEIQDIGDFVGDSFELSQKAASIDSEVIVFCGVYFMAETAKILSPDKKVLIPDPSAGCPMADMITGEDVLKLRAKYPGSAVVCYVNSTAEVKALSDICCTSGNAVNVVNSVKQSDVIFVPDMNLGDYVSKRSSKKIHLFEGYCPTHYRIMPSDVIKARSLYPESRFICHPECSPAVVAMADHVASTRGMLNYVSESTETGFIIGTEKEIIYRMKKENPAKSFFPVSERMICPNMKKNTLIKLRDAMKNLRPEVTVDEKIREKAYLSLIKMLKA